MYLHYLQFEQIIPQSRQENFLTESCIILFKWNETNICKQCQESGDLS